MLFNPKLGSNVPFFLIRTKYQYFSGLLCVHQCVCVCAHTCVHGCSFGASISGLPLRYQVLQRLVYHTALSKAMASYLPLHYQVPQPLIFNKNQLSLMTGHSLKALYYICVIIQGKMQSTHPANHPVQSLYPVSYTHLTLPTTASV